MLATTMLLTANDFANEETILLNDGDVCQMLSQYFVDIDPLDVFLINQTTTISMIFYQHSKVVHTTTMNHVHRQCIVLHLKHIIDYTVF